MTPSRARAMVFMLGGLVMVIVGLVTIPNPDERELDTAVNNDIVQNYPVQCAIVLIGMVIAVIGTLLYEREYRSRRAALRASRPGAGNPAGTA